MSKALPPRPNLDHLRKQAKTLLANLMAGDETAAEVFRAHLPAAKGATTAKFKATGFRLADAQSAVARQSGFGSWPQLARHVETLRALEGTWSFARLEVEGMKMPAVALGSSRILIDGDRFRTESPEAIYEGVFNIDVEAEPHVIEIEFIEGPEAGNWNYGIFRLNGDALEICLDMHGKPAPKEFSAPAGSGHACELLTRESAAIPSGVTGGKKKVDAQTAPAAATPRANREEFAYRETPMTKRLQGVWLPELVVNSGVPLPDMMLGFGTRTAKANEVKVVFGGQTMLHVLVRIDETTTPLALDYYGLNGPAEGTLQHGIMEWRGDSICVCVAPPGAERPKDFVSTADDGRTLSQWKPKKS